MPRENCTSSMAVWIGFERSIVTSRLTPAGISARMLTVLRRRGLVELVRAKRGPPYQPAIWRRLNRKEQAA